MMTPAFLKRLMAGGAVALLLLPSLLLISPGCAKETLSVATVIPHYSGATDSSGCGWVLELDSVHWYQAQNMPSQYLVEGVPIIVTYRVLQNTPDCSSLYAKGIIYIAKVKSP